MSERDVSSAQLNWLGVLDDAAMESRYWEETRDTWAPPAIVITLLMGGVFLLGAFATDYAILGNGAELWTLLTLRAATAAAFFVTAVLFFLRRRIAVAQFMAFVSFLLAAGLMVVALGTYPNGTQLSLLFQIIPPLAAYVVLFNRPGYSLVNGAAFYVVSAYTVLSGQVVYAAGAVSALLPLAFMHLVLVIVMIMRNRALRELFLYVDITRQLQLDAEAGQAATENDFRTLLENMEGVYYRTDGDGLFTMLSKSVAPLSGYQVQDLIGKHVSEFHVDRDEWEESTRQMQANGGRISNYPAKLRHKEGRTVWAAVTASYRYDLEGAFIGVEGIARDITKAKLIQQERERLRIILAEGIEALPTGFAYFDADQKLAIWNQRYVEFMPMKAEILVEGAQFEDVVRHRAEDIAPAFGYETVEKYVAARLRSAREQDRVWEYSQANGRVIRVFEHAARDGAFVQIIEDITRERENRDQLQQAQKMEAIGQLTGGIAHDFNNLLAVIMGNAELLANDPDPDAPTNAIIRASERGAELTQRLLAFSRQQPLRPEAFDMSALVENMAGLLARTLGEAVEIKTYMMDGLWQVHADPGQVENALLNLAINARDAMPGGGELTIECLNFTLDSSYRHESVGIETGDYVVLAVTDHGVGMRDSVRRHAFDPFFTTKDVGKGSGLGLSMVYGFAQQSGGTATIYSELGKGTTVKLYLPRIAEHVDPHVRQPESAVARGDGQLVLVLEDDPEVRNLAEMMLTNLGYRVLTAENAAHARAVVSEHPEIDLILSDVVLPGGMSGPEFAEELRAREPDRKVLFMSGYPAEAARRNGFLGSKNVLLNKPFRLAELARAVDNALDV